MTHVPLASHRPLELKECFADPLLDVMTFLNEVVLDYPDAVASGRVRAFYDIPDVNNPGHEPVCSGAPSSA